MILDRDGQTTDTNARVRHTECIEVVLAYPGLIQRFEEWLARHGMYLFPIPSDEDDLPTYGVGVVGERVSTTPAVTVEPTTGIRAGCPTCEGPNRETVDMVCQTCGFDYGHTITSPVESEVRDV